MPFSMSSATTQRSREYPDRVVDVLRSLLRCPECAGVLTWGDGIRCAQRHEFAMVEGIPILTIKEMTEADQHQHAHQREFYDREYGAAAPYRLENWQSAYLRRMAPLWEERTARPFLDSGAGGSAYTVIEAARRGIAAVACDLSIEAMKRAQRYAIAEGVAARCLFVVCGAERLPFADGMFGSAAAIAVLEHLPDDHAALSELARVTAPGGRVFLAVPNALERMPALIRPLYRRHDRRVGHLRHYSPDGLAERCAVAGLRVIRMIYSAHWVKVWQLAVHLAAGRLRINDDRLWWRLEALDARAADRPGGMHLNLILER